MTAITVFSLAEHSPTSLGPPPLVCLNSSERSSRGLSVRSDPSCNCCLYSCCREPFSSRGWLLIASHPLLPYQKFLGARPLIWRITLLTAFPDRSVICFRFPVTSTIRP